MDFNEFNLHPHLAEGIEALGFKTPTPIQTQAIPLILEGKDIIASAQTGTGKTAAFLLPIIHKIISVQHSESIKALIIVPTRELAMQIDQQLEGLSYFTSLSSIAVYGGGDGISFAREQQALSKGVDIVICTPGRMIAHLVHEYVKVSGLKFLILDEADRMLDMGFYEDIMRILSYLPAERQTLLFSATMPKQIRDLAHKILHKPVEVNIAISKPAEKILQLAYVVYEQQKISLIKYLLRGKTLKSVLIFCSTKKNAKELSKMLKSENLAAEDIHSDLDQKARENVLLRFKNRELHILVATNVLSRGIDVENIDLIINYDVPRDAEDYIHRIGRTARAESEGVAITLINEKEQGDFMQIEKLLGKIVHKALLPAHLGEVPVYTSERKNVHKQRKNKKKWHTKKK